MSVSKVALAGVFLLAVSLARAAEEDLPEIEFLEYLGSWEESDEEWLIFDESIPADMEKRSDPVPQGKESTETEDES